MSTSVWTHISPKYNKLEEVRFNEFPTHVGFKITTYPLDKAGNVIAPCSDITIAFSSSHPLADAAEFVARVNAAWEDLQNSYRAQPGPDESAVEDEYRETVKSY